MDKTQLIFVSIDKYLENVISLKEASEMLGITDGYLRQLVLKGEFEDWEYKKLPKVILFYKGAIEERVNKLNK